MEYIQKFIEPYLPSIKKYIIEIILIFLAVIITIISLISSKVDPKASTAPATTDVAGAATGPTTTLLDNKKLDPGKIAVEVSGAVMFPDVYEVTPGARLKDILEKAGGLSNLADDLYVARNYNLAKFVGDQEKIYIPYTWDIIDGTFVEQTRILEYLNPLYSQQLSNSTIKQSSNLKLSINTASSMELETLTGIGPVTAQKIIENRPYVGIDELISKKVMNQSTFTNIKNNIEL
ncbi:hypothetical protein COY14_00210 [Candidatus Roizmanbacteria bacterium CG_4_10_14_0_2_um_filter_36_9]|uniref:Soluble ligand binding domain-containing protein n=1 Tax=Candidatus Roizmanbacteria bacterium CG_4_10_14_0_2_um_filter_36_9 TaxID=1974823 RepID=A0A2M7U614_9BACT|nr:MAG: hypothetical protein COY14_00210 [Candidatus Roizmanbacteria bacterium CG_4_10_14_0_2_um_filter_36_9]